MQLSKTNSLMRRFVAQRNSQQIIWVVGAFVVAWIVGKSIAGQRFGIIIALVGLAIFLLTFFRKNSPVVLFPLVLSLPNIGLDLPGPWAITIEDAFVMLIFTGYLTRSILLREQIIPRDDKLIYPMLLFNAMAIICISKVVMINPHNIVFNIKELMRLTMLNLFYLSMINALDSKTQVMRMVKWLLIMSVPMLIISYWIYLTKSDFWYHLLTMTPAYIYLNTKLLRMVSIAGSTSFTGIYYAVIFTLAFHYLPLFRDQMRKMIGIVFVLAIFSAIVLTFNRGTWVGILFGLTVLTLQGHIDWRRVFLAALLLTGIVILSTTNLFGEWDVEQKVADFIYYSSSSAESRLIRWISAIRVITDHPIIGVGYNNYAFVYGHYSILEGVQPMYGSPHNMYVDVLTGTGFIGFSIFATLLIRLWRRLRDNMNKVQDPELRALSRGLFLALLFFMGSGGFDSFLFKPHHSTYLIVSVWAMGTTIYRIRMGSLPLSQPKIEGKQDTEAEPGE